MNTKWLQIPQKVVYEKFYVHEIAAVDLSKIYFLKNAMKTCKPNNDWMIALVKAFKNPTNDTTIYSGHFQQLKRKHCNISSGWLLFSWMFSNNTRVILSTTSTIRINLWNHWGNSNIKKTEQTSFPSYPVIPSLLKTSPCKGGRKNVPSGYSSRCAYHINSILNLY